MFNFLSRLHIISDDKNALEEYIKNNAKLIDVRIAEELSSGKVAEALHIPMQEVPGHLDKFDKKENIIVFCRTGNRSEHVKEFLLNHGFENVLNGGSWQQVEKLIQKNK